MEKWGVAPAQIPEVLCLVGDSCDNIPGVPTIGKKTAERLVLELKEKVKKLGLSQPQPEAAPAAAKKEIREDVLSALINLGYKEAVVQKALGEVRIPEDASVESILKQALKVLMK